MRVILDTNVLISAFLWQGKAKEIFNLGKEGKIIICVSEDILTEFQKVLSYPKFTSRLKSIGKTPSQVIGEFLEVVKCYPSKKFPLAIITEDPSDDKFLACAFEAQASFIISGDKHLLKLKKFRDIPILSIKEFLKISFMCK